MNAHEEYCIDRALESLQRLRHARNEIKTCPEHQKDFWMDAANSWVESIDDWCNKAKQVEKFLG